jgi:hypothetical protein
MSSTLPHFAFCRHLDFAELIGSTRIRRAINRRTRVRAASWVSETFSHVVVLVSSDQHVPTAGKSDFTQFPKVTPVTRLDL